MKKLEASATGTLKPTGKKYCFGMPESDGMRLAKTIMTAMVASSVALPISSGASIVRSMRSRREAAGPMW